MAASLRTPGPSSRDWLRDGHGRELAAGRDDGLETSTGRDALRDDEDHLLARGRNRHHLHARADARRALSPETGGARVRGLPTPRTTAAAAPKAFPPALVAGCRTLADAYIGSEHKDSFPANPRGSARKLLVRLAAPRPAQRPSGNALGDARATRSRARLGLGGPRGNLSLEALGNGRPGGMSHVRRLSSPGPDSGLQETE